MEISDEFASWLCLWLQTDLYLKCNLAARQAGYTGGEVQLEKRVA
jgi:hypothetical protein